MANQKVVFQTAANFSKFIVTDLEEKLKPISKLVDDMHARLEEFQTMIYFVSQERTSATNLLSIVCDGRSSLTDVFSRIDSVENLIEHVKTTLETIERDIQKMEEDFRFSKESPTTKVANILTPIFKKNIDKKDQVVCPEKFRTSDYFLPDDNTNDTIGVHHKEKTMIS